MKKRFSVTIQTVTTYVVPVECHDADDASELALERLESENNPYWRDDETSPEVTEVTPE